MDIFYYAFLGVLGCFFLLGMTRPPVAVAILLAMWPIKQALQAKMSFFATHSSAANFVMAAVAGASWIYMWSRKQRVGVYNKPVRRLAVLFTLLALASIFWAPDDQYAIRGWEAIGSYVFLFIFFIPELVSNEHDFLAVGRSFVWLGAATGAALMFCVSWEDRWIIFPGAPQVWTPSYGIFRYLMGNPLEVSTMAMRVAILALLLNAEVLGKALALLRWPILVMLVALILRSETRAPILVAAIVILVFLPVAKPSTGVRKIVVFTGIFCVLAVFAAWVAVYASSNARWDYVRLMHDAQWRLLIITNSWSAWTGDGFFHFLFGHGLDGSFLPELDIAWPEVGVAALVVDLGLMGLLVWVGIFYLTWRSWWRSLKLVRENAEQRQALVILGALLFADFLLSLKGLGYFYLIGWCVLITRYGEVLKAEHESLPEVYEPAADDAREPVLA